MTAPATGELDLLVLGSGVAGLSAAVRASNEHGLDTGVLTKGLLEQSTTRWAQGGVAAALSGDAEEVDLHLADTLAAGAGLCDLDAVRVLGSAVRHVNHRDGAALRHAGLEFNVSLIFGGQIGDEPMRLFMVYSAGNFIEATTETPFFQIGESKYGKPVLDRVITPQTPLDEAAKCALVSMDSTLNSNLSVGLPLDMVVYEAGKLQSDRVVCIDHDNPYYRMLHSTWTERLRQVFDGIEAPQWNGGKTDIPLRVASSRHPALKKITSPRERLI